jgi:hypothetical protein
MNCYSNYERLSTPHDNLLTLTLANVTSQVEFVGCVNVQ